MKWLDKISKRKELWILKRGLIVLILLLLVEEYPSIQRLRTSKAFMESRQKSGMNMMARRMLGNMFGIMGMT